MLINKIMKTLEQRIKRLEEQVGIKNMVKESSYYRVGFVEQAEDSFDDLWDSLFKHTGKRKIIDWDRKASPSQSETLYKNIEYLYKIGRIASLEDIENEVFKEIDNL